MQYLFTLLFLFCSSAIFAQAKTLKFEKDTINLRGHVADQRGNPIPNLTLKATSRSTESGQPGIWTKTDSLGNFIIKGIAPNDTILISPLYEPMVVYNKGARAINIELADRTINLPGGGTNTTRITKKKKPQFKVVTDEGSICFFHVEVMPSFPGGEQAFSKYISKNLVYPTAARAKNIEGCVLVKFTIERDGTVQDIRVLNSVGYGCDEEAVRVLSRAPRWSPGVINGRPFAMTYTVPVTFTLKD